MLRWLSELTDKDNAEVGPKIARLGTLRASGIEVPDGFAVYHHRVREIFGRK
jgi:phosphoenolpyruvate synthase/pyruvate phosphate dikinase